MKPLLDFMRERQQLSAAAFSDRYPWPVLVHRIRIPGSVDLSAETQFAQPLSGSSNRVGGDMLSLGLANAKAHVHLARAMGTLGASDPQALVDGSIVIFVADKPPGPAGLVIGRTNEAAYSLPYPKISKEHAYLRERAGRWVIVDAGSRNGTQMNGAPLPPNSPVDLAEGALLYFSRFQFLFYTSAGFYRILGEE